MEGVGAAGSGTPSAGVGSGAPSAGTDGSGSVACGGTGGRSWRMHLSGCRLRDTRRCFLWLQVQAHRMMRLRILRFGRGAV